MKNNYTSAQTALQKALIQLLEHKVLNQIQVKELCQKANVARSTFYAYYDNVAALLKQTEDYFIAELAQKDQKIVQLQNKKPKDFAYFVNLLAFVNQNRDLLTALVVNNYDYHLIFKWKRAIKANLLRRLEVIYPSLEQELILEMTASEVVSAFIFYLNHPGIKNKTIERIIAEKLAALKKYF